MKAVIDWLLGPHQPGATTQAVKKRFGINSPSFSDLLSFVDFDDDKQCFLLNDGISVGSGFSLTSLSAEAASEAYLESVFLKVKEAFTHVVPCHAVDPWVMQIYVQDDYSLAPVLRHIQEKLPSERLADPFTQDYLEKLAGLYQKMERPQGLFFDPQTGSPYRGRRRQLRILFYRRYQSIQTTREAALFEHETVLKQVSEKLRSPGLHLKRLTGNDYYQWWVRWFNPKPAATKGNIETLLQTFPYPHPKPAGFCLSQNVFFSSPESDANGFLFDGVPHRVLYVEGLKQSPGIGLLSREKQQTNPQHRYALLDKLPEGSIYTIQVTFRSDEALDNHLRRIEKGVVGTSLKPQQIKSDIKTARDELASGNRLFWVNQAIYYRADTIEDAIQKEQDLRALFFDARMPLLASVHDLHPLNSYLNALPFNFLPAFAERYLSLDRIMYASELAALLPVYGRHTGATHLPSLPFFNRLGEPVFYDLLHHDFISQNSHLAIFANSGAGKSVLTGWLIHSFMATKNARVVLFEMGNSFDRLLMHCRAKGKKVRQLLFSKDKRKAIPLNPFCDAYKALSEINSGLTGEALETFVEKIHALQENRDQEASYDERECDEESRDYLVELSLALRTMITEANEQEERGFTLSDETLLIEVLSDAIVTCVQANIPQMLTEHVVTAFAQRLEKETLPKKKERLQEMHDRLKSYVINSAKARFFNVPSESLDDFDIFHIDISAIKEDKGRLALVMVSLLPRILALAEATQNQSRPTFLVIDEAHLQFELDVVVSISLLIAKVARKLGLWLVVVTQNIKDLSSEKATKILTLIESTILLGTNEKELQDVKAFKSLTLEQEALIRSIHAEKGVYAEAVLLGSKYQGLFRVIPPRYLLALLMNEKSEKETRHQLEKNHDVLKAAEIIAEQLENKKGVMSDDHFFYNE